MAWELMQCNVCGGELVFDTTTSVYRCRCCRATYEKKERDVTLQTDMRQALNLRQSAKFVEARDIYKRVIAEHPDEDLSDAYWGLFLCEQNVLFEVDGKGEMFPSFYRVTGEDASDSPAYGKAIAYAMKHDREKMNVFANLGDRIDAAKKKYRKIEQTTAPYEVFICFKKTGNDDRETPDTQLATDLYNGLARNYNVFFSEKSLRGIAVREYEPNIYYALYTAKVLLLLCSKKEYIESQWLKNEWGRFTEFSRDAGGKAIIPIFLDGFNPANLPNELWHAQGLTDGRYLMSDLGDALANIIHPVDEVAELKRQQEEILKKQQAEFIRQQEEMKRQIEEMRRSFQMPTPVPTPTAPVTSTHTDEEEQRRKAEQEAARRKVELAKWNVGGNPTFGSYYKDNGGTKSPIKWIVLAREGNKALIISKYGIDCKPYSPNFVATTWETAPLRKWLNNEFLNTAFSHAEQAKIQNTRVVTPDNAKYKTKGGNATTDKIFLLSIDEAKQYFLTDEKRKCTPTAYAISKGAYKDEDNGCGWWWLRSPGYYQIAASVRSGGGVHDGGRIGSDTDGCVRPALWVTIESVQEQQDDFQRKIQEADVLYQAGENYYYGKNGKEKNYAEAVKWYRKAAEQGNVVAQNNLGVCYENGHGVTPNDAEAVKWYRKAAEQGYATAQGNLGVCYENGQGVTQDYAEAAKWFRKAAEQGNVGAQNDLGVCYKSGMGVKQDYAEAIKWYRKAAEQGLAIAQYNLGFCYKSGQGVTQNDAEAVKWWRKAAEQGLAVAQNNLGICYEKGYGVTQNYAEAVKWYRKAAEQGNEKAKKALERLS